ncbi:PREDICTED: uncharacterized protein LOC109475777 [Branchiostoma belcheri]|uniref:Uncharacterized protein LOC109475777 n=1 Tax=Branchiostoma belcheri TaxID=7741 RepID=A0A6P4YRM5_BRABE|nr:PREDICTED: uncharacterized protein LOC109475777 [Branchiostoma belcheri]
MGGSISITNDTKDTLVVSLNQAGPLYYELVEPGKTFYRRTGAVHFTICAFPYKKHKHSDGKVYDNKMTPRKSAKEHIKVVAPAVAGTLLIGPFMIIPGIIMAMGLEDSFGLEGQYVVHSRGWYAGDHPRLRIVGGWREEKRPLKLECVQCKGFDKFKITDHFDTFSGFGLEDPGYEKL